MIFILFIALIVYIIGKFLYDKYQQSTKIAMQGGMRNKYHELIGFLMKGDSRIKIYQETSDSITLGISGIGGSSLFILIQTFSQVKVQWKVESPLYGKHKLEWNFREYDDQTKMAEIILNDTSEYQQNLMNTKFTE